MELTVTLKLIMNGYWINAWVNSQWPSDAIRDMHLSLHWLRKWLVAWRDQAITWTNINLSSVKSSCIHMRPIAQWASKILFSTMALKIILLNLQPHFQETNAWMHDWRQWYHHDQSQGLGNVDEYSTHMAILKNADFVEIFIKWSAYIK